MSLLRIFAALLLSMTLANCAMFGSSSDDEKMNEEPSTMSDTDKESMESDAMDKEDDSLSDNDASEGVDMDPSDSEDSNMDNDEPSVAADEPSEPEQSRAEASAPFKDGMYTFSEDCTMREDPESSAASAGTVRGGKKLWVEGYDNNWVKVFKRSGPVFVEKSCL